MGESQKHILILSSWYPNPEHPFLGNFVQRHAELLSQAFKVTVLNTYASDTESTTINKGAFHELNVTYPHSGSALKRKSAQERAYKKGIAELEKVDLIIAHVGLPRGLQFIEAKKRLHCPLIYVEHGSFYREEKRNKWSLVEKIILRKLAKKADRIVAVSEFLKNDMQEVFKKERIDLIGNSVDAQLFALVPKPQNEVTQFLHVSTLDRSTKNPKGIIEACEKLHKRGLKFNMKIVSDEPTEKLKELADQKQLSDIVSFSGPHPWDEMPALYQKADCFILFSNYETFSIVLAESLLTGTPLITTPVGITNELAEGSFIPVKSNDPTSLADAMQDFIAGIFIFAPESLRRTGLVYSNESILDHWKTLIDEIG